MTKRGNVTLKVAVYEDASLRLQPDLTDQELLVSDHLRNRYSNSNT